MESNEIILQGLTTKQLIAGIKVAIKELFLENENESQNSEVLLTREEVCELLDINLSTLWKYTKKGKLKGYGIGRRVYYKKNEIINSITPLK